MTQPQAPEQNITADQGFARLIAVLSVWVPARLWHTRRVGIALRGLTRKGR